MATNASPASLTIDRRRLLKSGVSAGLLACLPLSGCDVDRDLSTELLRHVSDADSVINPDITGQLDAAEFAALFGLCEFVDRNWSFAIELPGYRQVLRADLSLKTGRRPSYLTEYRGAAELVDLVGRHSGSDDEAWLTLLYSERDAEAFAGSRLARARRFVFSEIIAHLVPISGAFKSFGFVNYRGYFGGPFASPGSYRRAVP